MGPDAVILVFWMLSFKPTFSLSSFTFIKRLFSSSSLFAIRVVSSAYLRLFIFLLEILIPDYVSSSAAFLMMYVPINKELFKQIFYILTQIPLIIPSRYKGKEVIILFLPEILSWNSRELGSYLRMVINLISVTLWNNIGKHHRDVVFEFSLLLPLTLASTGMIQAQSLLAIWLVST